jgi:hypothetical protein
MSHTIKIKLPEVPSFDFNSEKDTLISSFEGEGLNEKYIIVGINASCFADNPYLDNLFILLEKDDKTGYIYSDHGLDSIERRLSELTLVEAEKEKIQTKVMRYLDGKN